MDNFNEIQELLQQKADYHARLQVIPYDGSPEIKELNGKKYLYVRKRIGSRLKSTYVDIYSEELHLLCHIARLVNEGFFADGGRIRGIPLTIGGCSYIPPLPVEDIVKERISEIVQNERTGIEFLVIPEKEVPEFKKLLAAYYEGRAEERIRDFMKEKCWKTF